jgi:hypothetical protein
MQLAEVNFCGIKSSAPQEEIDALCAHLEEVYNNLPLATVWKQAVLKAASVDSYYAYDYTEDSYAALVAAKDALLEEVYAENPSDEPNPEGLYACRVAGKCKARSLTAW